MNKKLNLENIIVAFIENRAKENESTTTRHIHRRFYIPMNEIDKILTDLTEKKRILEFYDEEFQENRYTVKV